MSNYTIDQNQPNDIVSWREVPGFGHEGGVSITTRDHQQVLVVNARLPSPLAGEPIPRPPDYPSTYHSAIATSASQDGSLQLHYLIGMHPAAHPTNVADYETLECCVNLVWDLLSMLRRFSQSTAPLPLGLGYSVLCLRGYDDPQLIVLLGAQPSDCTAALPQVLEALRTRQDQCGEDLPNIARQCHRLLSSLFGSISCPEERTEPPLLKGKLQTVRGNRAEITAAARIAAVIADYFRYGERWESSLVERMAAAFSLGPSSCHFSTELNALLPPELWDHLDRLESNIAQTIASPPAPEPRDLLSGTATAISTSRSRLRISRELLLAHAAKVLHDSDSWKLATLGRTHW